jgi:hypothetical protein
VRDTYDDSLSLDAARAQYFAANGFGADGGYSAKWVDVKVGPISARIPNTKGRVRAVRFHDLHHVLTCYRTTFRGECEISAWEVASGCAGHLAAWLLNLSAFGAGMLFAAGDVWRAFHRGRKSHNLYRAAFGEALLARRLDDVRRDLRLVEPLESASTRDRIAFAAWSLVALLVLSLQIPFILPGIALVSRLGRPAAQPAVADGPDPRLRSGSGR